MFLPKMVKNWMARRRFQREIDDFNWAVNAMAKAYGLDPELREIVVLRCNAWYIVKNPEVHERAIAGLSPHMYADIEDDGLTIIVHKPSLSTPILTPLTVARWHAWRTWHHDLDVNTRKVVAHKDKLVLSNFPFDDHVLRIDVVSDLEAAQIVREFTGISVIDELNQSETVCVTLEKAPYNYGGQHSLGQYDYRWQIADIKINRTAQVI